MNNLLKISFFLLPFIISEDIKAQAKGALNSEVIVSINSDSVLNNYNYFKIIKAKFEEKSKKVQSELSAKGAAFKLEVDAYSKKASSLTVEQRDEIEERLSQKQLELQTFNTNAGNVLANEEAAENEKLYEKVSSFLKVYAKAKGYKLILSYSKTNPTVLFADDSIDITKEVVTGLNDAYDKGK